ncbi:MAG TPA: hypothetical protein VK762_34095 [Polyangiaceae bacterium]|nr:hypothetical protein [Polyangiaceae bacterium]
MIVVLASRFDVDAAGLVERWRNRGACLLTCEHLSRRGWIHDAAAPERSVAMLDRSAVPVRSIRGVVTRLSGVTPAELPHIAAEERAYVACEMTAFLVAWLSSLPCRVLNRPTPLSLVGPSWRPEQWAREATRAGLSAERVRRVARSFAEDAGPTEIAPSSLFERPVISVTVVHTRCFGGPGDGPLDDAIVAGVRRLAGAAGVDLLTATFAPAAGRATFVGAAPWVDVARADVADALVARIEAAS